MLDLFGFTGYSDATIQTFVGNLSQTSGSSGTTWYNWIKPRNINNVYVFCIGGGGGGGPGGSAATGTGAGGGSGGGSSAIACWLGSAYLLPDNLFVGVGNAGNGKTLGASASGGTQSVLSLVSGSSTAANLLLVSSNSGGGGGGGNPGTTGGAVGGSVGTIPLSSAAILSGMGLWSARIGQAGATGSASGANGVNITALSICGFTAGASGGGKSSGVNAVGGDITGAGIINTVSGGTGGNPGLGGFFLQKPFLATGGSGGGGIDNAVGGKGGDGAIGCGGGGGGAGTTGGAGGNGGPGLVVIISW